MTVISPVSSESKIDHCAYLKHESGFGFVKLNLTFSQYEALSQFSITESDDWIGYDVTALPVEAGKFLSTIGKGRVDIIASIIHDIALQIMAALNQEAALVIISSFMPTDEFNIPQWHIDWSVHQGVYLKFEATLIGHPTLFYPLTDSERGLFLKLDTEETAVSAKLFKKNHGEFPKNWDEKMRPFRLAKLALLTKEPVSATSDQGTFYVIANKDKGAVHSVPKIDQPRLVFAVIPGTKQQIQKVQHQVVAPV